MSISISLGIIIACVCVFIMNYRQDSRERKERKKS